MFGYKNQGVKGNFIEGDKKVSNLWQCVHCNAQFVVQRGSGTKRGFCMKCMGPLCGKEECFECLPFENWLDLKETGKTKLKIGTGVFRKISIREKPVI